MTLVDISEDRYQQLLRFLGAWWCLGSSQLEPYGLLQHLAAPLPGFPDAP
jgi:hypothetical protein